MGLVSGSQIGRVCEAASEVSGFEMEGSIPNLIEILLVIFCKSLIRKAFL
jgi:hypothetical protein